MQTGSTSAANNSDRSWEAAVLPDIRMLPAPRSPTGPAYGVSGLQQVVLGGLRGCSVRCRSCTAYVWIKRRFKDFPVTIDQLEADPWDSVTALIPRMHGINGDSARDLKTCWLYISCLPSQHLADL